MSDRPDVTRWIKKALPEGWRIHDHGTMSDPNIPSGSFELEEEWPAYRFWLQRADGARVGLEIGNRLWERHIDRLKEKLAQVQWLQELAAIGNRRRLQVFESRPPRQVS